ncbi:retinol dehydrogenase 13-like [Babylonia areolata]|uniref:retinol dehydrogenase 13-like n=1 Tax=Babylonia areolata TaxID=304850 RepID=UPI003FD0F699
MDLSAFLMPAGIAGATVGGAVLLKKYMEGGQYHGKERIPGKTVIITGANTGIGKATAKELACRGARVILACRDQQKAQRARDEIVRDSDNQNVSVRHLDLASMESIRTFAAQMNDEEDRIDILINNAGIMFCPKMLTEDGFEMQLGVNHLGHFLLTMLLLDKVKASAPSRIINLSSKAHEMGRIDFEDLNSEKSYSAYRAYSQAKLANVLFTRALAERLRDTGVTVNAVHPGAVDTELPRHLALGRSTLARTLLRPFTWVLLKTPVQGAQTSLHCALSAQLEGVTGKYFSDCREKGPAKQAKDDQAAERLWAISEKMTHLA